MRTLALLGLLAALAGARPGPHTALSLRLVEPAFRDIRIVEQPSCPPMFDVELTADMPDAGWQLAVDRVSEPDAAGRIAVEITAARAEGAAAQVVTPRSVRVPLGCLRKGGYLLDVHLRRVAGAAYERVQAIVLRGE
jgi:hypothetical protein